MVTVNASNILKYYFDSVEIKKIEQLNTGLINQTFHVLTNHGQFILQRINKGIFKKIPSLINNKVKVTQYLLDNNFKAAKFIKTLSNEFFVENQDEIWQLSKYIESDTIYRMNTCSAKASGTYLANFHKILIDFPINELEDSIPNFHNTTKRYSDLIACLKFASKDKLFKTQKELDQLNNFFTIITPIANAILDEQIPLRVVHNDTKITNFLFDKNGQVICLIDFDTIMAGSILNDIGDALRSACNTSDENERDLEKVQFSQEIYDAFISSYLNASKDFLTEIELENIPLALPMILFEQACRFLTDYYNNDIYYPIDYPEHNLIRCRTQLKLFSDVIDYLTENDIRIVS